MNLFYHLNLLITLKIKKMDKAKWLERFENDECLNDIIIIMDSITDFIQNNTIDELSYYDLKVLNENLVIIAENGIELSDEFLDFYNLVNKSLNKKEDKRPISELSPAERFLRQFRE